MGVLGAGGHHPLALGVPSLEVRRAVGDDHELGASRGLGRDRALGAPHVLADGHAHPHAGDLEERERCGAGSEVALLVEHRVVRQQALLVDAHDLAARADRGRVVEVTTGVDEPHHGRTPTGAGRHLVEGGAVGGDEARLEDEVLGRVAGDGELGEHGDVAAGGLGLVVGREDALDVAVEVADHRVELTQPEPDARHHPSVRVLPVAAVWEAGDVAEVVIPAKLARVVVAWEGDSGRRWLARLPSLVAELAAEWDLELDDPFEPGGNISWVAPARRRSDGVEGGAQAPAPTPRVGPGGSGARGVGRRRRRPPVRGRSPPARPADRVLPSRSPPGRRARPARGRARWARRSAPDSTPYRRPRVSPPWRRCCARGPTRSRVASRHTPGPTRAWPDGRSRRCATGPTPVRIPSCSTVT